jgi:hypothetical protein
MVVNQDEHPEDPMKYYPCAWSCKVVSTDESGRQEVLQARPVVKMVI